MEFTEKGSLLKLNRLKTDSGRHVLHMMFSWKRVITRAPQWAAADPEIKVPSSENTELKRSPFKALSRLFPGLAMANTGSCVGLQNKIGHPAGCRFPC